MAGKGYARFTDDDELGDTTLESPTSPPAVLQETLGEEDPSTAAEQHDLQPGLDLNLNNVTQEGTNPDTAGDVGQGDGGGDPGGEGGGNDVLASQTSEFIDGKGQGWSLEIVKITYIYRHWTFGAYLNKIFYRIK